MGPTAFCGPQRETAEVSKMETSALSLAAVCPESQQAQHQTPGAKAGLRLRGFFLLQLGGVYIILHTMPAQVSPPSSHAWPCGGVWRGAGEIIRERVVRRHYSSGQQVQDNESHSEIRFASCHGGSHSSAALSWGALFSWMLS